MDIGTQTINRMSNYGSMGGSIATKATEIACNIDKFKNKIQGLIVIDVVEGSAIEALPHMEAIVKKRPLSFKDPQTAIQWAYSLTQGINN